MPFETRSFMVASWSDVPLETRADPAARHRLRGRFRYAPRAILRHSGIRGRADAVPRLPRYCHCVRLPARVSAGEAANWALVAALAVSAQFEIWTDGDPSIQRAAAALLHLAATVPLAWRTTAPLAVAVIISASLLIGAVALHGDAYGASFQAWVAVLVALYSVAAHADRRGQLVGAAALAGTVVGFQLMEVLRGHELEGIPGVWLSLAIAFLLGRLRRWQMLDSVRLESRAAELERERDEKTKRAVAEERARIARELHDVVAHHLSVAILQIVAASEELPANLRSKGPTRHLDSAEESCRQALGEMRRLLDVLRTEDIEPLLAPTPGLAALDDLVAGVRRAGLPVEIAIDGTPVDLPAGLDLTAYRIVQEALTNALKYADGAATRLTVKYGGESVEVEVVDDGRHVGTAGNGSGSGLVGMRERVVLYDGRLEAGPREGGGFRVWAHLPLSPGVT
jgi:signal transduction histidine kinase